MNRRLFLRAVGIGTLGIAGGCSFSLEDGVFDPCLAGPMPKRLLDNEVVTASWQGIDPAKLWDCHVHIAGVGDGNTGVWITPKMSSVLHPWQNLQRRFYLNASCTEREGRVDEDFVSRLLQCLDVFPSGGQSDAAGLRLSLRRAGRASGGSERILRPEPLRGGACPTFSGSFGVDLFDPSLPCRRHR